MTLTGTPLVLVFVHRCLLTTFQLPHHKPNKYDLLAKSLGEKLEALAVKLSSGLVYITFKINLCSDCQTSARVSLKQGAKPSGFLTFQSAEEKLEDEGMKNCQVIIFENPASFTV